MTKKPKIKTNFNCSQNNIFESECETCKMGTKFLHNIRENLLILSNALAESQKYQKLAKECKDSVDKLLYELTHNDFYKPS